MNQDIVWQLLRYLLIAGGGYLASRGLIDQGSVEGIVAAVGTLVIAGWGIYVKWSTKAVPIAVVVASEVRPDVPTIPTVSSATGTVSAGTTGP